MSNSTKISEIKNKIMEMIQGDHLNESERLIIQLENIGLQDPDLFTLRAMLYKFRGHSEKAISYFNSGLIKYPLNVDLHINLALLYEEYEQYLQSYHFFMRADYLNSLDEKKEIIKLGLERLMPHIKGYTKIVENEVTMIQNTLLYGEKAVVINTSLENCINRLALLRLVEKNIFKNTKKILEIEFSSGIISKNLNYYGFHVEAIDSRRNSIVEIISKEWQENLRTPGQKKARYFHNHLTPENIKEMSDYDTIIFAPDTDSKEYSDVIIIKGILYELIKTNVKQIFFKVSKDIIENFWSESNYEQTHIIKDLKLTHGMNSDISFYLIEKKNLPQKRFQIPNSINVMNKSLSSVIEIEINNCIDKYGFSYKPSGFHPFVSTINQIESNSEIDYSESILKRFYDSFQPNDLAEGLCFDRVGMPIIKDGWIGYPWLWNEKQRVVKQSGPGETRPGGYHFFGPNSMEFGQNEFERLKKNLTLLKQIGYLPEVFSDGYVSGYLLKNNNEYRFVVMEGQHRVAVLSVLGYKKIRVRYNPAPIYPKIVDKNGSKNWSQVKNKVFKKNEAELIFEHLFQVDGSERVEQLGFLSNEAYINLNRNK